MLAVFDGLDAEEAEREEDRQRQADGRGARVVGAREMDRHRDGEAGGDQHHRVQRAERDVQVPAALGEGELELKAIDRIPGEEPGEEQDLGGEEEPHPQLHRLVLAVERGEVVREDPFRQAGCFIRHG